ncbi:nucleolin 1 [Herrania umbratica]|uniref:Nucleolin 1 n=1 Tax=Herrania umbratica TaxID=108875 RepID=A0A6J1A0S2_9ROSI|nr:nucleolin 1 [Herrania umbratica]
MGSVDRVDDLTFKVNFSGDGAAKLRERVKDKLKEFMGDYTDDTLVEYVIVLLRNGRRKDEARNELNVFLGDDSDSFVSWLWDHLASNLYLYVPSQEPHGEEEAAKTRSILGNQLAQADTQLDSDSEKGKSTKLARNRHNREWKGLVQDASEPPPLRSSEVENICFEEKTRRKVSRGRSSSPRPSQKKRSRIDERQPIKREEVSQMTIDAPRRLLQFAVRDAVGTSRSPISAKEPSFKRLRSVVSTSSGDSSLPDRPRRIRSVARVPNLMTTMIKAVAEAAEDVAKVKTAGSVFDRLGPGMDVLKTHDRHAEYRESLTEDEECGDLKQPLEKIQSAYLQRNEHAGQHVGNMTALESQTVLALDSLSDNEAYDDVNVVGHRVMDMSQTGTSSGNKGDNSLVVQYSVARGDELMQRTRNKDHDQSTAAANTSRKIVNSSVNVNTWKPPYYQEPREVSEFGSRKSLQEIEAVASKSNLRLMKENGNPVSVGNGNVKRAGDIQEMSQKTVQSSSVPYAAARPLEDADSRTIFVSNVHFAATKDSLSRHFNKFGEVLKVVIVTDAATGQPKGSAYVEFMHKEAADNALSLDGTSFLSRILKVVKRSSAHQEAASVMTWPRIARGSPFAAARYARAPFPRGIPGAYRSRLPFKPGARSLQWKRDAQASPADAAASVTGNNVFSPTARSLTYVRTEPKSERNASSS